VYVVFPKQLLISDSVNRPKIYPLIHALKGHGAFDLVFQHGARFAYRGVTAFILFRHLLTNERVAQTPLLTRFVTCTPDAVFVGVTAKRRTRPAVMRNRIKRLLRESVRNALLHDEAAMLCSADGVFPVAAVVLICNIIPETPSLLRLDDVAPLVERIFQNADKHVRSRHSANKQ
jgi:ribonuclease P protein component